VPGRHRHAQALEAALQCRPLEPPEAERELPGLGRQGLHEVEGTDLDDRQVEASCPQVEQRLDPPTVEQRRERDHQGLGGQGPGRQPLDVGPGEAEHHLGVDQRVQDPVELCRAHLRHQPSQHPAEAHQPDPVLLLQEVARQGQGRPEREIEGPGPAQPQVAEGVQEEHDVRVAFGVELVHVELAPERAETPVDAPDPVAGHERTDVRELDPVALQAGDRVAGEDLGLRRSKGAADGLGLRVDPERQVDGQAGLVVEAPEGVVSPHHHGLQTVATPAPGPGAQPMPVGPGHEAQAPGGAGARLQPVRQQREDLQPGERGRGGQLQIDRHLLALEQAFAVGAGGDGQRRHLGRGQAEQQRQEEGRGHGRRLGTAEGQGGQQGRRRQGRVGDDLRRADDRGRGHRTSIRAPCPLDRASRPSRVTSGQSSASAKAT
jgi:hypothetical protein